MTDVHIKLAYGRGGVNVHVPERNLLGIFNPRAVTEQIDEPGVLRRAMENPIGTGRLRELVHPGQKIAIVTSDMTRPTPTQKMLPFIAAELEAAGVRDEDVLVVLGLGLHRPMSTAEMEAVTGCAFKQRYRVINHDVEDTLRLGVTSRGTPVEILRAVVEADVRICLGNIEFHYFAGYAGGAKAILPACASRASIVANHAWLVKPGVAAGKLEGNPVRLDLEEGAAMLGVDFILNVVIDGEHNIVGAFAGDVTAAQRAGCKLVDERGRIPISRRGDIVLASAGGFPKDINLVQARKALENAKYFVREGGIIILVAECSEGFGNKTFEEWMLGAKTPDELIERIQRGFVQGGHMAAMTAMIERRAAIYLVSEFPETVVRRSRLTPFESAQAALDAALEKLGGEGQVLVLPLASSILPVE